MLCNTQLAGSCHLSKLQLASKIAWDCPCDCNVNLAPDVPLLLTDLVPQNAVRLYNNVVLV